MTCHQSCTSIGTGKCIGNFALYCIRTCNGNSQLSYTRVGAGFMILPVLVWYRKVYRTLCPILYQDMSWKLSTILLRKYRCQACVGNLTCPLHVLCKYWCRKCSFSSSVGAQPTEVLGFLNLKGIEITAY